VKEVSKVRIPPYQVKDEIVYLIFRLSTLSYYHIAILAIIYDE